MKNLLLIALVALAAFSAPQVRAEHHELVRVDQLQAADAVTPATTHTNAMQLAQLAPGCCDQGYEIKSAVATPGCCDQGYSINSMLPAARTLIGLAFAALLCLALLSTKRNNLQHTA